MLRPFSNKVVLQTATQLQDTKNWPKLLRLEPISAQLKASLKKEP
jgi:hypothetical protein